MYNTHNLYNHLWRASHSKYPNQGCQPACKEGTIFTGCRVTQLHPYSHPIHTFDSDPMLLPKGNQPISWKVSEEELAYRILTTSTAFNFHFSFPTSSIKCGEQKSSHPNSRSHHRANSHLRTITRTDMPSFCPSLHTIQQGQYPLVVFEEWTACLQWELMEPLLPSPPPPDEVLKKSANFSRAPEVLFGTSPSRYEQSIFCC